MCDTIAHKPCGSHAAMKPRRPGSPSRERASDPSGDPSLTSSGEFTMAWKRISAAPLWGNKPRGNKPLGAVTLVAAAAALVAGLTVAGTGGASAAPHAGAVAAQAPPSCTSGTTVQTKDGPVCGQTASSITSYLRHPLRRTAGRRTPLAAAPAARAVVDRPAGHHGGPGVPEPGLSPGLAASRGHQRGLPLPQGRSSGRRQARRQPAGHVRDPRRRVPRHGADQRRG